MNKNFYFRKRIFIISALIFIFFSLIGFLNVPVQAGLASGSVVSDPGHTVATIGGWLKDAWQYSKDQILPALRDAAIKRIMDQITDDTVKWIENGGEPRFVSDWNGFLEDNFSAAVGDVILQTKAAPICSPFKAQINFMLLPRRTLSQRARCTIEDIGLNLQNFYDDFSSGGWIGYSESWSPQNNYFMTAMMVYDEALIAGQKAQQAKIKEAESGKGFLSMKRCIPASSDKMQKMLDDCVAQQGEENYDLCQQETEERAKCDSKRIITPGDAVGEAFRDAVTSDSQWAKSAQSALSLIVNALINRVLKEGIDYVKDAAQREQQRETDQRAQDDIDKTNYQQQISPFLSIINDFKKEWTAIRGIKEQSYDAINGSNGILPTLNEIQTRNCQPPYSATVFEINDASSLSINLNNEIADLNNKITEADKTIKVLNDAKNGTDRDRIIAQQNYGNFEAKYSADELQNQIITGSGRNAADTELTDLRSKLDDARNRLQLCIQAQQPQQ